MTDYLEVSRRNGRAVEEALRRMDEQIREQQRRIDGLNATISSFALRLEAAEGAIARVRIKAMGGGPTEGG